MWITETAAPDIAAVFLGWLNLTNSKMAANFKHMAKAYKFIVRIIFSYPIASQTSGKQIIGL